MGDLADVLFAHLDITKPVEPVVEAEPITHVRLVVPKVKKPPKPEKDQTGWANGSLGSFGSVAQTDDSRHQRGDVGPLAYVSVDRCPAGGGGVPQLAWFYCASSYEIGMFSSQWQFENQLNLGGPPTTGGTASPSPPNPIAMNAAFWQRHVRERLTRVPPPLRTVLERAYSDRRYPTDLVVTYGVGIAPLVWYAQKHVNDRSPGQLTLDRLVGEVREWWHDYEEVGDNLQDRIHHAADTLLWTGHAHYGEHVGGPQQRPARRRKRRARLIAPELVQQGEAGCKRRKLVLDEDVAA